MRCQRFQLPVGCVKDLYEADGDNLIKLTRSRETSIITIFTVLMITNFRTNRYPNNFQGDLFGILKLRNTKRHFKISFSHENEAVKHDLVEFKAQCLKVSCCHGNKSTILLFNLIFRTTPEVSS